MSISIIHPSRNRPEMAYRVAQKWINSMSGKYDMEYIMSIDDNDSQKNEYEKNAALYFFEHKGKNKLTFKLLEFPNNSAIDAINNAAKLSRYNLIVVVSDDFDCFEGWDTWLMEKLKGQEDFLVKTSDGLQERLITLPIMDRKYYERFGYVYYPEYKHMFCDTEMTEVGHILGRVIDLRDDKYVFSHLHYTAGKMQKDEINEKNDATWNQGEALFNSRKEKNFYL